MAPAPLLPDLNGSACLLSTPPQRQHHTIPTLPRKENRLGFSDLAGQIQRLEVIYSMAEDMVERVARATYAKRTSRFVVRHGRVLSFDEIPDALKEAERDIARTAIEAMREPTEGMIEAATQVILLRCGEDRSTEGWARGVAEDVLASAAGKRTALTPLRAESPE